MKFLVILRVVCFVYGLANAGDPCLDINSLCESMAELGYCESSSEVQPYMLKNCKRSCDQCDSCKDKRVDCEYWVSEGHCRASQYQNFVLKNCKRSCGKCGCIDQHILCSFWKSKGYCKLSNDPKFMIRNCRKSCGACD